MEQDPTEDARQQAGKAARGIKINLDELERCSSFNYGKCESFLTSIELFNRSSENVRLFLLSFSKGRSRSSAALAERLKEGEKQLFRRGVLMKYLKENWEELVTSVTPTPKTYSKLKEEANGKRKTWKKLKEKFEQSLAEQIKLVLVVIQVKHRLSTQQRNCNGNGNGEKKNVEEKQDSGKEKEKEGATKLAPSSRSRRMTTSPTLDRLLQEEEEKQKNEQEQEAAPKKKKMEKEEDEQVFKEEEEMWAHLERMKQRNERLNHLKYAKQLWSS
ncbi:hypothetical protein QOT17_011242 [Balamuthia mandrillaris]